MDVRDIVKEYLIANGYDGLYDPLGDCGCIIDDLFPCDVSGMCCPGYKVPCPPDCEFGGDCDWHIGEARERE